MIAGVAFLLAAVPMQHMHMPGMTMPMPAQSPKPVPRKAAPTRPKAKTSARRTAPAPLATAMPAPEQAEESCPPEHAAMGHCTPAAPSMAGMAMPGMAMETPEPAATSSGTDLPAGNAPPPAAPTARAADAFYDPAAMAAADRAMRAEHGGMRVSQVIFNLAERQIRTGRDGWRWDGEGWFGGDIHRLVVKTEGEATVGRSAEAAEVQALYARAVDPYWNLQAGVRQDLGRGPKRSYATIGVEGLAPYWFDVEGALFLSDRGDLLGRVEAWYDQRITQRLIAQPRVEVNVAAQDMPANGVGSGLSSAELGLRLRYEIRREFAPYVGVSWERRYGETARFARAKGGDSGGFAMVAGVRAWF